MYARQQAKYGYVPNYAKVFSHRPDIMPLWANLLAGIRRHIDPRRFELVTFAAAQALGSSSCTLAHGKALRGFLPEEDIAALAAHAPARGVTPAEESMMRLARKVVRGGATVTASDIEELRGQGVGDAEIFDVVATAAGRAFFANLIEALGSRADPVFADMDHSLRAVLTVGRPIDARAPERMPDHER
jgi:AhpD family alkylhydroperoxidase